MTDIIVHKKNNLYLYIETELGIKYDLNDYFSFFVKGYKFMPAYKAGYFDGKIRLYKFKESLLPSGLLLELLRFCKKSRLFY